MMITVMTMLLMQESDKFNDRSKVVSADIERHLAELSELEEKLEEANERAAAAAGGDDGAHGVRGVTAVKAAIRQLKTELEGLALREGVVLSTLLSVRKKEADIARKERMRQQMARAQRHKMKRTSAGHRSAVDVGAHDDDDDDEPLY